MFGGGCARGMKSVVARWSWSEDKKEERAHRVLTATIPSRHASSYIFPDHRQRFQSVDLNTFQSDLQADLP